jgi:hypothetical protein
VRCALNGAHVDANEGTKNVEEFLKKLREYQRNRLKYHYVAIEFYSVNCADIVCCEKLLRVVAVKAKIPTTSRRLMMQLDDDEKPENKLN